MRTRKYATRYPFSPAADLSVHVSLPFSSLSSQMRQLGLRVAEFSFPLIQSTVVIVVVMPQKRIFVHKFC